ncbi:ATP-binding protein [Marinobacter sp. MBR-105]
MEDAIQNYGLENIVLHHSFRQVAGRTIKIPCSDRTHLGGVNGAGKTSVLQLIPAFYGEEPERIVTRAADKDSFLDYFLPTLQSLIIFEYRRHTGLCCSVMMRHPSGKLIYRFVEGGLNETFFDPSIRELLAKGSTNDEIFQAFRDLGIRFSQIIDIIKDYRAVIQQNAKLLKRQPSEVRRLRALANDYGLGGPTTSLQHIDRLTHVVLNKDRMLSSFKTMICETMFDIHLNKRPTILHERDLVNDIRSIKAFAEKEPTIRHCLLKEAERQALKEQTVKLVAKLCITIESEEEIRKDLLRQVDELQEKLEGEQATFNSKDSELGELIADYSHRINQLNKHIDKLYEQRDQFEEQGLPELDLQLTNLQEYRTQLADAERDYEALSGKFQALESEHDRQISEIKAKFEHDQKQRELKVQTLERKLQEAEHAHKESLSKLEMAHGREVSEYRESRHPKRAEIDRKIARLEIQRDHPSPSEEERNQILEAEEAVSEREGILKDVRAEHTDASEKLEQARYDRATAHKRIEQAQANSEKIELEFEHLQRQLTPDPDSWLAHLRREDPEWSQGLAKVINPELLELPGLQPVLIDPGSTTIMGWDIQLSDLPVPDSALSEDEIQAKLQAKDAERVESRQHLKRAEDYAGRANDIFSERERECERLKSLIGIHEGQLQGARTNLSSVRSSVDAAISTRTDEIVEELKLTQEQLKRFDEDTQQTIDELGTQYQKRRLELLGQWSDEQASFTEEIENAQGLLEEALEEHKARLERLKQAYEQRLSDEGIDPEEVRKARSKRDTLREKVTGIESSREDVLVYRSWRTREWSQLDSLQTDCNKQTKEYSAYDRERKERKTAFEDSKKALTGQIINHRGRAGSIGRQLEAAIAIRDKFDEPVAFANEMPGNLGLLTEQLQDAHKNLDQLRMEVLRAMKHSVAVINAYENTQVYAAWRKLKEYRISQLTNPGDQYTDEFELAQVDNLRLLLEQDLPHLRMSLIAQFASAAGELRDYFDGLQLLSREVRRVSNTLRSAINDDQRIEAIGEIEVVLHPRIHDDESWVPLKNFVENWRTWMLSHRGEIPSDDLIRDFHQVVTTLRSARINHQIESMVDMKLVMVENGRRVEIRSDNDLKHASSTGLSYLAIMIVFISMTRYLAPDTNTRIIWPIDELETLSGNNISSLATMLDEKNITMISACPGLNHWLRKFFENKLSLKDGQINIFGKREDALGADSKAVFARAMDKLSETEVSGNAE